MGIEQGPDGMWRDTTDTSNTIGYHTRDQALAGYGYSKGDASGGFLGSMAGLFGNAIPLLIIAVVLITAIYNGVRQYWLYILAWLPFYFLFKGCIFQGRWKTLLKIIAFGVVVTLFAKFIFYPHVNEPSIFTDDYVVIEADIHSRRFMAGKAIGQVSVGEKVTVNGVSRDRLAFNITTSEGITGWISADAFPEDANFQVDAVLQVVKAQLPILRNSATQSRLIRDDWRNNDRAMRDRDWFNVRQAAMGNYFGLEVVDGWGRFGVGSGLTQAALSVAHPVNTAVTGQYYIKLNEIEEFELILHSVMYLPEVTIVRLHTDHERALWSLLSPRDQSWEKSIVLTCLDTGERFPIWDSDSAGWDDLQVVLFFPPTKSRHFSIIHERTQGWLGRNSRGVIAWDFPEVVVR